MYCPKSHSMKIVNVSFIFSLISIFVCIPPTSGTITVMSRLTNETLLTVNDGITRNFLSKNLIKGIEGFLVHSNPGNACSQVRPPPLNYYPPNVSFYLLTQRYDCESKDKMENAHIAGYDGIIIHNINYNTTDGMGDDVDSGASDIIKYASYIGEYDGHRLMNYSLPHHKGYFIKIQDGEEITILGTIFELLIGFFKLLGIIIGVAIAWEITCGLIRLIGLGCETGFNWIIDSVVGCWRRRNNESCRLRYEEWWRRLLPIPETNDVGTAPAPCPKPNNKNSSVACVVCLEDFVQDDRISILPCSHTFHNACILRWLNEERKVCPLCKRMTTRIETVVYSEESELETDDDEAPLFKTPSSNSPRPNQFFPNGISVLSQQKCSAKQSGSSSGSMLSAHDWMENSWYTVSDSTSVVGAAESNIERVVPSHLSHSTTDLGHGEVTLDNTDAGTSTGHSHPHYFILGPESEDEEMLSCTVEVDDFDPRLGHSCNVVVDDGSDHAIVP